MGSTDAELDAAVAPCRRSELSSECEKSWFEDEYPQNAVTLDGFWIDQTEVTNAQYRQCVEAGKCATPACYGMFVQSQTYEDASKANHPVNCVGWYRAQAYCEWTGARLPTEAEWEYAARGEQGYIYPWGNDFDCSRGNFHDKWIVRSDDMYHVTGCDGYTGTAPAGSFPIGGSWCGALDMAGNVQEWVADVHGGCPPLKFYVDPSTIGNCKMLRGGSYMDPWFRVRAAYRAAEYPAMRHTIEYFFIYPNFGFRCVTATLEPPTPTLPPPLAPVTDTATSLIVTHSPNPARVRKGGHSGYAYTCAYTTTVKAVGGGVRIEEFGAYDWINDQWVLSTFTGKPFTPKDFADWYSCPGAYIEAGQECTDPNNWTGGNAPFSDTSKWYFKGIDDNGNIVIGEAVVECQP